jgi:hypothetical protein
VESDIEKIHPVRWQWWHCGKVLSIVELEAHIWLSFITITCIHVLVVPEQKKTTQSVKQKNLERLHIAAWNLAFT